MNKVALFQVNLDKLLNGLPPRICKALDTVFANDAYLAGGFARHIARLFFGIDNKLRIDDLRSHVFDIDVYHDSQRGLLRTQDDLERLKQLSNMNDWTTRSQYAHTHFISCGYQTATRGSIKIQLILQFMRPSELFETFDIANSCVALNKHGTLFVENVERWHQLENARAVSIKQFGVNTVQRIAKYMMNHSYETIAEIPNRDEFIKQVSQRGFLTASDSRFKTVKSCLTNDELLQISMMCSEKQYDHAMKELIQRSMKKKQHVG